MKNTLYNAGMIERAYRACLLGATDETLAKRLGVAERTVKNWYIRYPEFRDAVRRGKRIADENVVTALHSRALGFQWAEEQAIRVRNADGSERVEIVRLEKTIPPDTTACIFWLKNRDPDNWKDRIEHTGRDGAKLPGIEVNFISVQKEAPMFDITPIAPRIDGAKTNGHAGHAD